MSAVAANRIHPSLYTPRSSSDALQSCLASRWLSLFAAALFCERNTADPLAVRRSPLPATGVAPPHSPAAGTQRPTPRKKIGKKIGLRPALARFGWPHYIRYFPWPAGATLVTELEHRIQEPDILSRRKLKTCRGQGPFALSLPLRWSAAAEGSKSRVFISGRHPSPARGGHHAHGSRGGGGIGLGAANARSCARARSAGSKLQRSHGPRKVLL